MQAINTEPKYLLVDYGRRAYAFGLPWFSSNEEESNRKQALALIKKLSDKYDLLGERKGDFPQYTIASSDDGMRAGAISAASIVADLVNSSDWLYVAKIKEAFWITYGRNGLIMPDGDKIYSSEDEAKQAFKDLSPTRWKSVSVPEEWKRNFHSKNEDGITLITSDIEESNLSDILQKPTKTTAILKNISSTGTLLKAGGGAILLGGAGFLLWNLFFSGSDGPSQEDIRRQAEILAQQQKIQKEEVFAKLDAKKPWTKEPGLKEILNICYSNIDQIPLQPAGYQLNSAECRNGMITGYFKRGNSHPSWLREWSLNHTDFQINISIESSDSYISKEFEPIKIRGPENLTDYITMQRFLNETNLLIDGTMTYTQPIQYTYEEYPDYIPLYGTSNLKIETDKPKEWKLALEKIPGIVIEQVKVNTSNMMYTLEGKIYVSNQ